MRTYPPDPTTQIGRDGERYPTGDPQLLVDPPATGGGGFTDGQVVDWYASAEGVADATNGSLPTTSATVYAADGTDLLDVDGGDLTADALELGDDYYLNRTGADALWFRTAGLYLVQAKGPAVVDAGISVNYGSSMHGFNWSRILPAPDLGLGPDTPLMLSVGEADVSDSDLTSGVNLLMGVINASGSPQDLWVEIFITRVA